MRDRSSEEYMKAIVREMASSSLSGRQFAIRKADSDSKADKKRIKELERELARKEKALAEAAALLLLR